MILRLEEMIVASGGFKDVKKGLLEYLFVVNASAKYTEYCHKVLSWVKLVEDSQPGTAGAYEYRVEYMGNTFLWSLSNK